MEFLKEVFGSEALTYDQLAEKLKGSTTVKLGNLAGGAYVGADKYKALETKVTGLEEQLGAANTKLAGYDPEWKAKAEQAAKDAEARVAAVQFDTALDAALTAAKAKNPATVKALLKMDGLKLSDGQVIGLKEQLETIQKDNDFLFESDQPQQTPKFTKPGTPPPAGGTDKDYLDGFYKDNPFYKK